MDISDLNSDEILKHLQSIAQSDGVISTDEEQFLSVVEKEIASYKEELTKFIEKGKIGSTEKLSLYNSRMRIVRQALDAVMRDYEFSDDEQKLFSGLKSKLKQLEAIEEQYQP